ncbi:MAG: thioredoxin domain-containing protein [Gemmatimonadales bacterium]|jgi:protein-disulfide isomerase
MIDPLRAGPRARRPAGPGLAMAMLVALGCSGEPGTAQETPTPAGEPALEDSLNAEPVQEEWTVLPTQHSVLINRADQSRIMGSPEAPVRILEVSDFQCPFCARFNRETFPVLDSLYIATGKVEYVWISFANPSHQFAWPAIEAAFCAGAVGKFWQMHDILFERQGEWSTSEDAWATFVDYARELSIDGESFGACLRDDRTAPLQIRDFQSVNRAGISSTPFFIIADSLSIRGAAQVSQFRTVLDSLLKVGDVP